MSRDFIGLAASGGNSAVECQLPKLDVAGSIPVPRSNLVNNLRGSPDRSMTIGRRLAPNDWGEASFGGLNPDSEVGVVCHRNGLERNSGSQFRNSGSIAPRAASSPKARGTDQRF